MPVPPVWSRATAVIVPAAAGLTFALLTIWVAGQGSAVPGVDEHVHSWVISHRSPGSVTFARAVTWGGVTRVVLPALIAVGAVAAKGGRDIRRRLGPGLLLAGGARGGRGRGGGGISVPLCSHHRGHAVRRLVCVGSGCPGPPGLASSRRLGWSRCLGRRGGVGPGL